MVLISGTQLTSLDLSLDFLFCFNDELCECHYVLHFVATHQTTAGMTIDYESLMNGYPRVVTKNHSSTRLFGRLEDGFTIDVYERKRKG